MLGVGGVAPPCTPPPVVLKRPSGSFQHRPNIFLRPVTNYTQFSQGRNGFRLFARNKKQGSRLGNATSIELDKEVEEFVEDEEGFEIDGEFDDVFDDDDDDEEIDDDDDVKEGDLMLPLEKMNDWLKNRPKGFGEGKVYDTSIEDELMEEIEKSREAQVANLNKLKNASKEAKPKKELKETKAPEVVSSDIRVRINNLPKKMNVQRDLKAAFQGVRGIVNISPVNMGNSKTRDPVCKGFGFVDFKSLEDANRFVQKFSGQSIPFGKLQKQIKCEILKPQKSGDTGLPEHGHRSTSEPRLAAIEEKTDPPLLLREDDDFDEDFDDDEDYEDDFDEDDIDDFEILIMASDEGDEEDDDDDDDESEWDPAPDSSALKQKKAKGEKQKPATNKKPDKIAQPSIPGSATRLKVRERADLAEVFAKLPKHGVEMKKSLDSEKIIRTSEVIEDEDSDIEDEDFFFEDTESFLESQEEEEDEEDVYEDDEENIEVAMTSNAEKTPKKAPKNSVEELGELLRIQDPAVLEAVVSRLRKEGLKGSRRGEDSKEKSLLEFLAEKALKDLDEKDIPGFNSMNKASKEAGAHINAIKSKIAMSAASNSSSSSSSSSSSLPKNPKEKAAKSPKSNKKTSRVKEKKATKDNKAPPKPKVPGSANRLKGRDKAKLTDVFSKYGTK